MREVHVQILFVPAVRGALALGGTRATTPLGTAALATGLFLGGGGGGGKMRGTSLPRESGLVVTKCAMFSLPGV